MATDNHSTLVAPAIGAAVEADSVEMAAIGLLWAGADADVEILAGLVFDEFAGSGRMVREGGELVADPDATRAIVAKRVATAVDKHHGVFVRLGISAVLLGDAPGGVTMVGVPARVLNPR